MWFGALVLVVALSTSAGCGGAAAGKVPVDSPLVRFEEPDDEDLGEPGASDTADDAGEGGE